MLDAVVVSDVLTRLCGGGLRAAAILTTPSAVPAPLFRNKPGAYWQGSWGSRLQ
jgi:hypothetical protein